MMADIVTGAAGTVIAGALLWGAKSLSELAAQVSAIKARLDAGADEMDRIEGRIDDHETRIRDLEQR